MECIVEELNRYFILENMRGVPIQIPKHEIENSLARLIIIEKTYNQESRYKDPIIPYFTDTEQFEQELLDKSRGLSRDHLTTYVNKLKQIAMSPDNNSITSDNIEVELTPNNLRIGVINNFISIPIINQQLGANMYNTLRTSYLGDISDDTNFNIDAVCVILRYITLGGFSLQWAILPDVINNADLTNELNLEVFASAINHNFPRYCSLFPDIEFMFGSIGRFPYCLNDKLLSDNILVESNPPFIEKIIQDLIGIILKQH
jgi:hypothetical protein